MTKATLNINGKATEVHLTDDQVKAILEASKKITDRVKSYEDACAVMGIDPESNVPYELDTVDPKEIAINAFAKMSVIAEALNEGWKPDWKSSSEWKYYPFFYMDGAAGFAYGAWTYANAYSLVGSRLCFKTSALAEYAGKTFTETYKQFYTF